MSKPNTHKCEAAGCDRDIAPRFLMCPSHWRLVPVDVQRQVYRTWSAFNARTDLRAKLSARASYLEAVKTAVLAVKGTT